MRVSRRQLKLKVILMVLVIAGALILGEARPVHANNGYGGIAFLVIAAAVTYATVMTTICTPVAAIKAADHAAGFGGAFKNCFWLRSEAQTDSEENMLQPTEVPAPQGDNEGPVFEARN